MSTKCNDIDPAAWWRVIGFPCPQVAVSGDLDRDDDNRALEQLREWSAQGVTDIIDVRGEWSDEAFVAEHSPGMRYHWLGTDDWGNGQPDEWFEAGVAAALQSLADPDRTVMVHCHMGVNRGPSMAFAIMLALGFDPIDALAAIRGARPIAAIIYAQDALLWWHRRRGSSSTEAQRDLRRLRQWHRDHPVDVAWVVSRIRLAEAS